MTSIPETSILALLRTCAAGELRAHLRARFERHALRNVLVPLVADLDHLADLGADGAVVRELEATVSRLSAMFAAPLPVVPDFDAAVLTGLLSELGIEAQLDGGAIWPPLLWLAPRWAVVAGGVRRLRLSAHVLELEFAVERPVDTIELLVGAARAVGAHAEISVGSSVIRASSPDPPRG